MKLILKLILSSFYKPDCDPSYFWRPLRTSLGTMKNFLLYPSVGCDILHLGRFSVESAIVVLVVFVGGVAGVFTIDSANRKAIPYLVSYLATS